jgi:hypothetical protein
MVPEPAPSAGKVVPDAVPAEQPALSPLDAPAARAVVAPPESASVDRELQEWKQARAFKIPWRQLSLMASLCFGIASFVLPEPVNTPVQWLLYGLAAASLYGFFAKRLRNVRN